MKAGHGGPSLSSQLLEKQNHENLFNMGRGRCSEPRLCNCTTACVMERNCQKNKKSMTCESPTSMAYTVYMFFSKTHLKSPDFHDITSLDQQFSNPDYIKLKKFKRCFKD